MHKYEAVEETSGHVLAEVGPSVTAAAVSECLAFVVGALTRIPALQQFCIVAGTAVFIDYFMQLTWFLAALSLDARRARVGELLAPLRWNSRALDALVCHVSCRQTVLMCCAASSTAAPIMLRASSGTLCHAASMCALS